MPTAQLRSKSPFTTDGTATPVLSRNKVPLYGGVARSAGVVYHPKRWRRVTQVTSNFRARCQSLLDKRKMCAIYVIDPPSWAISTNGAQFSIFVKNKPTNRI